MIPIDRKDLVLGEYYFFVKLGIVMYGRLESEGGVLKLCYESKESRHDQTFIHTINHFFKAGSN